MLESPRKRPFILVVDESQAFRLMAHDVLEQIGAQVAEAADGPSALRVIERERPDLVLLDIHLPGADGFEVCAEIRRLTPEHEIPVVMVTSRDHVDSIRRAYEAGATDFITKPVNWLLLGHRVRYMLRMHAVLIDYRRSQERLATAQRIARLGSWELDLGTRAFCCSEELRRIYGFLPADGELASADVLQRIPAEDRETLQEAVTRAIAEGSPLRVDHRAIPAVGQERVIHTQAELIRGDGGLVVGLAGTSQDVTDRKRAQAQIRMLAYHDGLTRLANRRLFRERLKQALAQATRQHKTLAILALDLDHFKRINDTFGPSLGDLLIQQVAARLGHCVRESDCVSRARGGEGTTTVSRLGGDEFMVLLSDVNDAQDAAKVASRILQMLVRPFAVQDHELVIGGSIGITVSPADGSDIDTLLRNADSAMYHAKNSGRNIYKFYESSMNEVARKRLRLESELRRALESGGLHLHYQPKIAIATGAVTGFEALVRWNHPSDGAIPPGEFIPVAEQGGLIVSLGAFVLETACRQAKSWYDQGYRHSRISVNISPHQFRGDGLVATVNHILALTALPPELLELEITESALMENEETAVRMLEELKGLGVSLSLDDFGTGYSSLSYLKRFPVDCVKIDRSFVRDIASDPDDAALAATIISMGKCLRLDVVAEGVETEEQLAFLREHGCDEMQGYLVSPPVPPERAVEFLARGSVWDHEP